MTHLYNISESTYSGPETNYYAGRTLPLQASVVYVHRLAHNQFSVTIQL